MKNCEWFMRVEVNNKIIGIAIDDLPEEVVDYVYLFTKYDGVYGNSGMVVIRYWEGMNAEELESIVLSYVEHNICHAPTSLTSSQMTTQEAFDPEE